MTADLSPQVEGFAVGGLFAGIGGIELGFAAAGHHAAFFCEREPAASAVLSARFAGVPIYDDVRVLPDRADELPHIDVLTGGFPCQDLSQAGRAQGIGGEKSGLVAYMFQLLDRLDARRDPPTWFVIENVTNMLRLDGGEAMRFLTMQLEQRGYGWAYRVVDTLGFGLPQRRKRVLMVASRRLPLAPAAVLFADEAGEPSRPRDPRTVGFYWTEGLRGLGWAPNAVPTLKGGSGLGIPSPPAVWIRDADEADAFRVLSLEQAEKLQGFTPGWTDAPMADEPRSTSEGERWRMVGNAVSVPVARWLGERMRSFGGADTVEQGVYTSVPPRRWPDAASGYGGRLWLWDCGNFPRAEAPPDFLDFVGSLDAPLSARAALGFRERTLRSKRESNRGFCEALDAYLEAHGVPRERARELSEERGQAAMRRQQDKDAAESSSQLGLFAS